MKEYKFPNNFWWGAATSGPQTEGFYGKAHKNIMDYWYETKKEDFFNGVGPDIASDFYHTYQDDIKLMKEIGMNSFRTSIQWSRLIKDLETGEIDKTAKKFYDNVIDSFIAAGIEPVINLYHFDMPIELQQKYDGWLSRETIDLFVLYAKQAFALFGDRVKYWAVFNEPMVVPEAGYMYGFHYPNKKGEGKKAVQIMYHEVLATAKTIQAFKESKAAANGGKICTILNLTPAYPASDDKADQEASQFVDDFFNNVFVETAINGKFPEALVKKLRKDGVLWKSETDDEHIIKENTVDFLGVNYYHPKRVMARKHALPKEITQWMPDLYFEEYDWPEKRINPYRGWEIYPKAVYDIAIMMKEKYPNTPWFMSENGMGVEGEENYRNEQGEIEDDYRIDFYKEHLTWLHKAIAEGSDCFGYHAWTGFDCWSWNNAYKNRYGFIGIDLKTQKRSIKKSGYWFKEVTEKNGF
ncbi:glycoside hydrolase family 1 protein [Breznakia sp. OttesenSCG-928-G09]|nr:glycoside hydrolase family 1 protein [Breznakia sp. OttesenSCG-928-G09]